MPSKIKTCNVRIMENVRKAENPNQGAFNWDLACRANSPNDG